LRRGHQEVLESGGVLVVARPHPAQHVIALDLHLPRVREQRRHRGQEDRCGLAPAPQPHEAAHRLGEVERVAVEVA
jgi:hypothetical protein